MLKKQLALIILLSFSFLLIPRDYWHHCEKHEISNSTSELSFEETELACDICDFTFFQLDQVAQNLTKKLSFHQFVPNISFENKPFSFQNNNFNKGPPNFS